MQDRALIEAGRQGDLSSCRQLVELHGDRAARAAFLLTGDPASAGSLAVGGIRVALERLLSGEEEELANAIAAAVARRYLDERDSDGQRHPAAFHALQGMERQRFAVDNERTRTRGALALLDARTRAAVILRYYCGLPEDEVAAALGRENPELPAILQPAVERLLTNLDLDSERDLALALATATFDAPRPDVWDEIAPDVEQHFEREERRHRVVNAVSAIVVVVGLLAGVLVISGAFSDGDDEGEAAAISYEIQAATSDAVPLIMPTPTATPRAEVADLLLASSAGQGRSGTRFFDPRQDGSRPILPEGAVEAGRLAVAPDGRQVVMLWYEFVDGQAQGYAALFGPELREMLWKTQITSAPHDPESASRPSFMFAAALNHQHVFIARHHWQSWEPVEIEVLDRASGERLETIMTTLAGVTAHDVRLIAPPGHDAVHLFAITREAPANDGHLQISFFSYQASGGEQIMGRLLRDVPDSRSFFLYNSKLSRDGSHLFGVDYTDAHQEIAVHFFDLQRGLIEPRVRLPFQPVAGRPPVQQAVSHDGRWLYVLSPASLEMAIVDLDERRLQGIIPLDSGVLNGPAVDVVHTQGHQMQLSPDGRRLYAIGASMGDDPARASGIWVIDTSTWTVVQHLAPETVPAEILLDGDGASLYIRESGSSLAGTQELLYALDLATSRIEMAPAPLTGRFSLASLASLYRTFYAASPWVDGRAPMAAPESRPLARARVEVEPERVEADEPVTIEVHFVHPLDGSPVEETAADNARFRPPAFVRAMLEPPDGGNAVIVDLGPAGYGVYRGVAVLPDAGRWSLRVNLDWPAGQIIDRTLYVPDAVTVEVVAVQGGIGHLNLR